MGKIHQIQTTILNKSIKKLLRCKIHQIQTTILNKSIKKLLFYLQLKKHQKQRQLKKWKKRKTTCLFEKDHFVKCIGKMQMKLKLMEIMKESKLFDCCSILWCHWEFYGKLHQNQFENEIPK